MFVFPHQLEDLSHGNYVKYRPFCILLHTCFQFSVELEPGRRSHAARQHLSTTLRTADLEDSPGQGTDTSFSETI